MEYALKEIAAVEQTVEVAANDHVRELAEIHLALVGGGMGDVVFA